MSTATILNSAEHALKQSDYAALRGLSVEKLDDALVIYGKVPSYYMKQLAQEAVMSVRGPFALVNRVDVVRMGTSTF